MLILMQPFLLVAQGKAPKWMNNSRKAVVYVTTYDKDNKRLQSGTAFFVTGKGEALSAHSLFKGAARAEVTTIDGVVYPVERILGADEMYDAIRFKVNVRRDVNFLPMAKEPLNAGEPVFLLPYSTDKNIAFKTGKINSVSNIKSAYGYYEMSVPITSNELSSPFLTSIGEVVGLAQADASGKDEISYALSGEYSKSLQIASSVDLLSSTYSSIGIKKAWPKDEEQANVSLYLIRNSQSNSEHVALLNDFVETFPNSQYGYSERAGIYLANKEFTKALDDIKSISNISGNKGDFEFNQAKFMFDFAVSDSTFIEHGWTVEKAKQLVQDAIAKENLPVYNSFLGDICFYLQQYEEAYDAYMKVNASDLATHLTFYMAAKTKEQMPDVNVGDIIALLDSAVNKSGNPPSRATASYILERIDWRLKLMQYKEAIDDYDLYYNVSDGNVGASFYYYRGQAKFRVADYTGALEDMQSALNLDEQPDYYAEIASVFIRMEQYDKALESLDKALAIVPDFSSCYRLKAVCFIRQSKKAEACTALNKAKELGDPLADRLIKEHCN